MQRTGKMALSQRATLLAFAAHPGVTTKRVAELTGLDYHEVARRAPQLWDVALLDRVEDESDGCYRWTPTERAWRMLGRT